MIVFLFLSQMDFIMDFREVTEWKYSSLYDIIYNEYVKWTSKKRNTFLVTQ